MMIYELHAKYYGFPPMGIGGVYPKMYLPNYNYYTKHIFYESSSSLNF